MRNNLIIESLPNTYLKSTLVNISNITLKQYFEKIIFNKQINNISYLRKYHNSLKRSISSGTLPSLKDWSAFPFIFIGDHQLLLFDKETFCNTVFINIFSKFANKIWSINQISSTIKCIQYPRERIGPCYIKNNGKVIKIFEGSLKSLKKKCIGLLNQARFTEEFKYYLEKSYLKRLLKYDNNQASSIIMDINLDLITKNSNLSQFYCNDDSVMDFIEDLLLEEDIFTQNLLLSKVGQKRFLKIKERELKRSSNYILNNTTDIFYYVDKECLRAIKIIQKNREFIVRDKTTNEVYLTYKNKNDLISLIQQKKLYPDLVTSYIYTVILTELRAMGGASQIEYLPIIKDIFNHFIFSLDELKHLSNKTLSESSFLFIGILNNKLNGVFNISTLIEATNYVENN